MKKDIHPDYHPVCFVDVSSGKRFLTYSTMTSKDKEVIDGVEYYIVIRDVTSDRTQFIRAKSALLTRRVVLKNSNVSLAVAWYVK